MKYKKSLFIFRRDLRLEDNTALINALKNSDKVLPIFIFNNLQFLKEKNNYFSENAFEFMINSLKELNEELKKINSKLYFFLGENKNIINKLTKQEKINAIFVNKDYTHFSNKRDEEIKIICKKNKIDFNSFEDLLLNSPKKILKKDKKPYTIFTPFYKFSKNFPVDLPIKNKYKNYYNKKIDFEINLSNIDYSKNPKIKINGGRKEGLNLLKKATFVNNYESKRNFPFLDSTTFLSAHHKFGTISIRESFFALKENEPLVRQLYWRDFFTHIAFNFPRVFGNSFNKKYSNVCWIKNKKNKNFLAWKKGLTGFPIVDAGMRELNNTGYMHNRLRMITASFLTKDLHIDWMLGENYFAKKLIDYDPCVNNGSWQWSASTGCDAQPYFRIFNPWIQQEKFDADCKYIKKWVLELNDLNAKEIHNLYKKRPANLKNNYPEPIVDHKVESKIAIANFKNI